MHRVDTETLCVSPRVLNFQDKNWKDFINNN